MDKSALYEPSYPEKTSMKHTLCLLLLSTLPYAPLSTISIVYNFRIAQITKQPVFDKREHENHTLLALLFDQHQKKYHNDIKQHFTGGLASFIYDFEPYYLRVDGAVSHIQEKKAQTTIFTDTETDDILFTFGRNFILADHKVITLSGLFGIPTHKLLRLQHIDFGYSQVGSGVQLDGSCELRHDNAVLYGARYIHFIPRNAADDFKQKYQFSIGNIADLLFAYKQGWNKHGLECGYTARFQFGAHIFPHLYDIIQKTNYIRSNFYSVYKYKFKIHDVSNRLLFNISYGFDHIPKIFGNQYIITLWGSWSVHF